MTLNLLDGIIILFLGLLFSYGLFRGLFIQIVLVVAIYLAVYASQKFGLLVCDWIQVQFSLSQAVSMVLGFVFLWCVLFTGLYLITYIVRRIIEKRFILKSIDRLLGGGLLLAEGLLILCLFLYGLELFPHDYKSNLNFVFERIDRSTILQYLNENNLLLKSSWFRSFDLFARLDGQGQFIDDPSINNWISQVQNLPKMQSIMTDTEIKETLLNKEVLDFIRHPKVNDLVNDPTFIDLLSQRIQPTVSTPLSSETIAPEAMN